MLVLVTFIICSLSLSTNGFPFSSCPVPYLAPFNSPQTVQRLRSLSYGKLHSPTTRFPSSLHVYNWSPASDLSNKEYALIAKQAYKAYKKEQLLPEDKVLEIKSGDLSFGFINIDRNKKIIVISLRGTKNPSDWLYNIDMKVDKANYAMVCGTHSGYLKLANLIFPKIKEQLQIEFPDLSLISNYQVYFTGHSLGGAVAQILAIQLYYDPEFGLEEEGGVNNNANQIKILSFSSPKVFSSTFNDGVYPLGDANLIRINHEKDLVPRLPFSGEYKQFGTAKSIAFSEEVWNKVPNLARFFGKHSPVSPIFHHMQTITEELEHTEETENEEQLEHTQETENEEEHTEETENEK